MMAVDMARTSPRTYRITPAIGTSQTFTRTPVTSPRYSQVLTVEAVQCQPLPVQEKSWTGFGVCGAGCDRCCFVTSPKLTSPGMPRAVPGTATGPGRAFLDAWTW